MVEPRWFRLGYAGVVSWAFVSLATVTLLPVSHSWVTHTKNAGGSSTLKRRFSITRHNASPVTSDAGSSTKDDVVPIILLSGFLGSGKTTALKHLLENKQGKKLGVIVNDVAAVNVDAKLVAQQQSQQQIGNSGSDLSATISQTDGDVEMIELQNGCACCSIADELITSVNQMLELQKKKKGDGNKWDAIVVELSGVADPIATKSNWAVAKEQKLQGTDQADISRIVTLVDSCTFGTDWMTWDSAGERELWVTRDNVDDCAKARKVPELLAEQVEAADLVIINKVDLAGPEQVDVATAVARGLNEKAQMLPVEFGKVQPEDILFDTATIKKKQKKESTCSGGCTDSSHSHSHSHEHAAAETTDSSDCSDPDCSEPGCTDSSHSHSHEHAANAKADDDDGDDCNDPDCTDTSHSHSHSHSHENKMATSHLGISNFVYKASVPFQGSRLMGLLNTWPVPMKETLDIGSLGEGNTEMLDDDGQPIDSPFVGVLRSKGFCWIAPTKWTGGNEDSWRHDTAMFWSHAGKHFSISISGKWWGTVSKEEMRAILANNPKEYDRIVSEDFVTEEFSDRRQEVVFIGSQIDEKAITKALDDCLMTDEELNAYRQHVRDMEENQMFRVA